MNSKRMLTLSALACAGLVFPLAGTAAAAEGELTITVTPEEPGVAATTATLTCNPDGGDHPAADAACAEIEAAGGDLTALPGEPGRLCTFDYRPVTVTATGSWRGQPVNYQETFPNTCVLISETGSVFVPETR